MHAATYSRPDQYIMTLLMLILSKLLSPNSIEYIYVVNGRRAHALLADTCMA